MDHAIIRPSQSLVKGGGPAAQFRLSYAPRGESWEAFALDGFRIPPFERRFRKLPVVAHYRFYFVHRTHDSLIQFISEINHPSSLSNGSGNRRMPDIRQMVLSDAIKLLT
jgi:hypothetical protein